jgi:hypothetical protein
MRPLRSFLLLLIFLACFTGLHYFIQVNQLFPSIYEFVPVDLINGLFSGDEVADKTHQSKVSDTIKIATAVTIPHVDTLRSTYETSIIDPMQKFLDSLRNSKGQIRILYYGDSQIEGDRITSYLRQTLRNEYGGTGPGMFQPLMPVMYTKSVWLRSSSNWKRYNYRSYKTGEITHRNLGPFMAICRYLQEGEKTSVPQKATVRIRPSNVSDSTSAHYEVLRVLYSNTEGIVNVVIKADDIEVFADTLCRNKGIQEISCSINGAKDIVIEFTGRVSPDIYCISIESKTGVIVDNIPQRGSAGLEFTMVDRDNLTESYKKLSPDLFILHYGLNIVKNVRNDYSYYQRGLGRQLLLLKEISPLTPILVISLSDMAVNYGDSIISYRNIPAIIEAQKKASADAGVAFWDSYRAMGGESSIIRWSEKKPPLAQKDYVHFTYPGADTLSKILADALFSKKVPDTNRIKYISIQKDTVIPTQPVSLVETPVGAEGNSLIRSVISSLFKYNPDEPLIFSTPAFWIFFLFVLAGYSLIYKKSFLRNGYLFLVSLFFYYKSGGVFLFLLIFVTLIDFTCGLLIHHSRTKFMRRFYILLSIFSNLGILAYFKYTGFFVDTINDLFGTDYLVYDFLAAFSNSNFGTSFNVSNIILPVGISFFTFQSLSYTFDVYRRKMEPVRNVIDFGFYVSFFPQLVAGPIVRASEFIPQLYNEFHLSKREFSHALFLISKGLIKKIIISDFIAINFIDRVFDAPSIYSGFENLMAVYGYG